MTAATPTPAAAATAAEVDQYATRVLIASRALAAEAAEADVELGNAGNDGPADLRLGSTISDDGRHLAVLPDIAAALRADLPMTRAALSALMADATEQLAALWDEDAGEQHADSVVVVDLADRTADLMGELRLHMPALADELAEHPVLVTAVQLMAEAAEQLQIAAQRLTLCTQGTYPPAVLAAALAAVEDIENDRDGFGRPRLVDPPLDADQDPGDVEPEGPPAAYFPSPGRLPMSYDEYAAEVERADKLGRW